VIINDEGTLEDLNRISSVSAADTKKPAIAFKQFGNL
jgi:hypothetical protein